MTWWQGTDILPRSKFQTSFRRCSKNEHVYISASGDLNMPILVHKHVHIWANRPVYRPVVGFVFVCSYCQVYYRLPPVNVACHSACHSAACHYCRLPYCHLTYSYCWLLLLPTATAAWSYYTHIILWVTIVVVHIIHPGCISMTSLSCTTRSRDNIFL